MGVGSGQIPSQRFFSCALHLLRLTSEIGFYFAINKWLSIIINDDFLEVGEFYCVRVNSLAQWLEYWSSTGMPWVRFPARAFLAVLYICCGFHVIRWWLMSEIGF